MMNYKSTTRHPLWVFSQINSVKAIVTHGGSLHWPFVSIRVGPILQFFSASLLKLGIAILRVKINFVCESRMWKCLHRFLFWKSIFYIVYRREKTFPNSKLTLLLFFKKLSFSFFCFIIIKLLTFYLNKMYGVIIQLIIALHLFFLFRRLSCVTFFIEPSIIHCISNNLR